MEITMAEIPRINGDVLSGINQNTEVGELISFSSSKPIALSVIVNDAAGNPQDIREEVQAGEAIEAIVYTILNKVSLTYLQIENDLSGQISFMLEENGGGWTAENLQTAIRDLGTAVGKNSIDMSGTIVLDLGFKLATN